MTFEVFVLLISLWSIDRLSVTLMKTDSSWMITWHKGKKRERIEEMFVPKMLNIHGKNNYIHSSRKYAMLIRYQHTEITAFNSLAHLIFHELLQPKYWRCGIKTITLIILNHWRYMNECLTGRVRLLTRSAWFTREVDCVGTTLFVQLCYRVELLPSQMTFWPTYCPSSGT